MLRVQRELHAFDSMSVLNKPHAGADVLRDEGGRIAGDKILVGRTGSSQVILAFAGLQVPCPITVSCLHVLL